MRKVGSDISYLPWLIGALVIMPPLVFQVSPLAVLLLPALPLFFIGVKKLLAFKGLKAWEKVAGKLKATDIGVYQVLYDRGGPVDYYFPLAFFEYEYKGQRYESNRYAYDRKSVSSTDSNEIKNLLEQLEEIEQLDVYVNPLNPQQAVLNIEISRKQKEHQWVLLISGILLFIAFIAIWSIS